eukprot:1156309-Pelagomonas_calceolata.AAC.8
MLPWVWARGSPARSPCRGALWGRAPNSLGTAQTWAPACTRFMNKSLTVSDALYCCHGCGQEAVLHTLHAKARLREGNLNCRSVMGSCRCLKHVLGILKGQAGWDRAGDTTSCASAAGKVGQQMSKVKCSRSCTCGPDSHSSSCAGAIR